MTPMEELLSKLFDQRSKNDDLRARQDNVEFAQNDVHYELVDRIHEVLRQGEKDFALEGKHLCSTLSYALATIFAQSAVHNRDDGDTICTLAKGYGEHTHYVAHIIHSHEMGHVLPSTMKKYLRPEK
jgi:hypothetical protein